MKVQLVIILCFGLMTSLFSQTLKPYTIGAETSGELTRVKAEVIAELRNNGFEVLGSYTPAKDQKRTVIAITSNDLLKAVKQIGGLTGFASALRVAITTEGNKNIISYTTPQYWGNAYFGKNYHSVATHFETFNTSLEAVFKSFGEVSGRQFGSKKGIEAEKLQKYNYMLGMPKFKDNVELNEFPSFEEAKAKIDGNFKAGLPNLKLVYSLELADQKIKLYGVGLGGEDGEESFLPTIDISNPKHTAFLPYEMLVLDNKVYMLHGRFRIALSFPDLSMGTFMKIVSTPKDIIKLLEAATE